MTKKFVLALVSLMVLAAVAVGSASAGIYCINISAADAVFFGESGLNITSAVLNPTANVSKIAWYSPGTVPGTDAPAAVYDINGTEQNFYVSPTMFTGYTGAWYRYTAGHGLSTTSGELDPIQVAFYVYEPSLSLAIYNNVSGKDITNKKVVADDTVTFRVASNLYSLFARSNAASYTNATLNVTWQQFYTSGIDIKVKSPDGATLNALVNHTQATNSLSGVKPNNQLYYLINNALAVDAWEINISQYSPGLYEAYAQCNVNSMKDNLGSVTGKTVSATGTLDVDKDTISVTADKETVIRNNDFTISIEGKPKTVYYVWFTGTSTYTFGNGTGDILTADIPPQFMPNQDDVNFMNNLDNTAAVNLNYVYKGTTTQIRTDVATSTTVVNNPYAINVTTGTDGTAVVGIETHQNTKAATYTIRVQKPDAINQLYDTVKVKIEKGAVTVTASGDGSYYLGEEVVFSGTNTDSDYTYLFITGPNLNANGAKLDAPTTTATVSDQTNTFVRETVKTDNTWEYKLETAGLGIDAGTYTVYAVNTPKNKADLSGAKYDTVSIVVKKPFVTATVSASTVAKGDKLYIRGTAEGNPTPGVAVWILGKNYWNGEAATPAAPSMVTETVNDDGSFEYEFGSSDTVNLASGQYFVVVQHPMYNDRFDVFTWGVNPTYVVENVSGITGSNTNFIIWGNNKLQGSDAAEALITSINSADIDDTYTKLTFLIEEPWIRINAIGDHYVGDQFTIAGTTNLAVDDDIICEVTSSSFKPTQKTQSGEFSGQSSTVKVVEGETYNEWSMDVDASTFKPDEYIVNVESIETTATATTTFNVLTGQPTVTATATSTGAAPVTATATATQATPTSTAAPGFGALVALIGLGAVAALVLRKE
ncbi:MAG: DUF3821 domain-containing protein [Methanomicrobiaceae archaeon]|nr:DUF3821 domain-containing protein [Methanomicrobiaceae archaeon]